MSPARMRWAKDMVPLKGRPVVYIVDDDYAVRAALKFSLEIEGYAVRTFCDGADILAERHWADRGCLVIDFGLPGMDGICLFRVLRARDIALPAILITGMPSHTVQCRAALEGLEVIEKPFLDDTLLASIRRKTPM